MCGQPIKPYEPFVNSEPTNVRDPSETRRRWLVPAGTDIHGWTPFVVAHPECFAQVHGREALAQLKSWGVA
jgi:hypothetical protein